MSFILAAVPDKPTTRPTLNLQFTSSTSIHVDYAALSEAENGGADIISNELQIYDRTVQSWVTIAGGEGAFSLLTSQVYSKNIEKGETYQLKYRVWNINGPGQFSEIGYIQAAEAPSRPLGPIYLSSDYDSISLGFTPSSDNGGSQISDVVLEISPYLSTNWEEVVSYDASTLTHTLTTTDDPIVSFGEYRFRYKSVNAFGSSLYSPEIAVAAMPIPFVPEPVQKLQELSS